MIVVLWHRKSLWGRLSVENAVGAPVESIQSSSYLIMRTADPWVHGFILPQQWLTNKLCWVPLIDLKPFEVAMKRQSQSQKKGRGEEDREVGRRGMEKQERRKMEERERRQGVGCQHGGKHGCREKEWGMKKSRAWIGGWRNGQREVWGWWFSFLVQNFPAHTTSTQLHREPGVAFTHTPTQKHTLLNCCKAFHCIRGAEMWMYLHKWVLYSEPVDSSDG